MRSLFHCGVDLWPLAINIMDLFKVEDPKIWAWARRHFSDIIISNWEGQETAANMNLDLWHRNLTSVQLKASTFKARRNYKHFPTPRQRESDAAKWPSAFHSRYVFRSSREINVSVHASSSICFKCLIFPCNRGRRPTLLLTGSEAAANQKQRCCGLWQTSGRVTQKKTYQFNS